MSTVILTGGGTAGHCTPNLALIPYLKNDFDKIYYIGSENGIEKSIVENAKIPYYGVSSAKLKRSFSCKNFAIPFKVIKGVKQAGKILDELKPDVVFSKGGYVALPVVIAAKKRKIPVIAHESDYSLGLANKISARYCKKILTSFPETAKTVKRGEYCGSPVRDSLFGATRKDGLSAFGFTGEKPVLLITGGSLGAKALNAAVSSALPELLPRFDVLHICGKGNLPEAAVRKGYRAVEFVNEMEKAFACADVCITRAGANSLFELACLKIPCVLIPLPKGASRGDQLLNAEYFQKLGLAYVLYQDALTAESLVFAVEAVYANRYNFKRNFEKHPINSASRAISRVIADYKR